MSLVAVTGQAIAARRAKEAEKVAAEAKRFADMKASADALAVMLAPLNNMNLNRGGSALRVAVEESVVRREVVIRVYTGGSATEVGTITEARPTMVGTLQGLPHSGTTGFCLEHFAKCVAEYIGEICDLPRE